MSRIAWGILLWCLWLPALLSAADGDTLVVVVRHAEKATDDPRDPSLSAAGQQRAAALAEVLATSPPAHVYATQYRRTQLTAAPAARLAGAEIEVLAAGADSAADAERLKADLLGRWRGRTVLVVGHSNTVPGLVQALSGESVAALADSDYDRLYLIVIGADHGRRLVQARYGAR